MTTEQRRLVQYWISGVGLILAARFTSFLDIKHQQSTLLVLSAVFGIISVFQDFSYYKGYGNERKQIGDFIEAHPKLKVWLISFCTIVLPYFIYKMQADEDVSGIYYFLSFLLLFGPIVAISEMERFRSMGNHDA